MKIKKYSPAVLFLMVCLGVLFVVIIFIITKNQNYKKEDTDKIVLLDKKSQEEIIDQSSTFEVLNLGGEYYSVLYTVPKDNTEVREYFKNNAFEWIKDTNVNQLSKDDISKLFGIDSGCKKYEYNQALTKKYNNDYISYIGEIYEYTCGAHGSTYHNIYNIKKSDNSKIETLSQIYNPEVFKFLSDRARQTLPEKLKNNGIDVSDISEMFEEGTRSDPENFSNFYFEDNYLVIVFGQYSIGPYAMGITEMKVPLDLVEKYRR